jgi:hypothetical protein
MQTKSSTIAPGLYAHRTFAHHWLAVLQPTPRRGYHRLVLVSHPGLACRWVSTSTEGIAGPALLPQGTIDQMMSAAGAFAHPTTGEQP